MNNDNIVPEWNFWERSSFVSTLPNPIKKYFFLVKEKFGMDIANLILVVYNEWGREVAIPFAKRILSFDSFDDLIRFLQSRSKKIGDGKELLNDLIFSYQYSFYLNELIKQKQRMCKNGDKELATKIFHLFASLGLFYPPLCIVQIAEVESGCRSDVAKRCKNVYNTFIKLKEKGKFNY